jgi:hypothetical protein
MRPLMHFALCAFVVVGCREHSDWDSAAIDDRGRRWLSVYRDAEIRVFVDSANISPQFPRSHLVWYRTDHRVPHVRHGKRWNREVSRSLISCENRLYKIVSADLSMGDADPISTQYASAYEVSQQQWRDVAPGSADEATLLSACAIVQSRRTPLRRPTP